MRISFMFVATLLSATAIVPAGAQATAGAETLFHNVRVYSGTGTTLSAPVDVLVRGNVIASIGAVTAAPGATIIDGGGRTLMPGMIDAHVHLMFAAISTAAAAVADIGYLNFVAGHAADGMLMQGFTSVRDMGGPTLGLKKAIDAGLATGPRIWPSGAMISQSGGHGDFRMPTELPAPEGSFAYGERIGAIAIADDPGMVRKRAREQLALGVSQIKMMAGGGVGSSYDPIDVTEYTEAELRAGVEAAENWGTYTAVHAFTPRAVQQAIAAGVKAIEHGHLLDDVTAKLMGEKGVWWVMQPFTEGDVPSAFAEGSPSWIKQRAVYAGTDTAYKNARAYHVPLAWGTDILYSAENLKTQSRQVTKLVKWFTAPEALKMVTHDNAQLLALSGPRNPYPGKLGVIETGALADMLLVDGDPIANLDVLANPEKNLHVIMKDGKIYKNTLTQ